MAKKDSTLNRELLHELLEYRDGNFYWKKQVGRCKIGDVAGVERIDGYKVIKINNILYYLHRVMFFYHHGYFPEMVDHINGIRSDNRIENLRGATRSQNGQNRKKTPNTSSNVKGVSWVKSTKNWKAQITLDNKIYYLGMFKKLEDAEKHIKKIREELVGVFTRHE